MFDIRPQPNTSILVLMMIDTPHRFLGTCTLYNFDVTPHPPSPFSTCARTLRIAPFQGNFQSEKKLKVIAYK